MKVWIIMEDDYHAIFCGVFLTKESAEMACKFVGEKGYGDYIFIREIEVGDIVDFGYNEEDGTRHNNEETTKEFREWLK